MLKKTSIILLTLATPVLAVKTSYWKQTTQADFKSGQSENLVATSHGELRLSREIKPMLDDARQTALISALLESPDGSIFVAADTKILQYQDGKFIDFAEFEEEETLNTLALDKQGRLLVGTSGEHGRVYRVEKAGAEPKAILEDDEIQHVWSMSALPDGTVYIATGPTGKIFELSGDDKPKELAKVDESNVTCLLASGDNLYAGTDTDGLVYRINRATGEKFALYDAVEPEISSLALDAKGNLYVAATTVAESATAEPPEAGAGGQPENPAPADTKIEGNQPLPPIPVEPMPSPGDPQPIPHKAPISFHLMADAAEAEPVKPVPVEHNGAGPVQPKKSVEPTMPGAQEAQGNSVYRIDPQGFSSEVYHSADTLYCMVLQNNSLLLGTGETGEVIEVNLTTEESSTLAHTASQEVTAMLVSKNGPVYLGLSNAGQFATMSPGLAKSGNFQSPVLDATQTAHLGNIHLKGQLPQGAKLEVSTRSSNVADPEHAGWSEWTQPVAAKDYVPVTSPAARYFQYKLNLSSSEQQQLSQSPVIEEVEVAYALPNLSPRVASVTLTSADTPATPGQINVAWEATDPNEDELKFDLFVRPVGKSNWIKLAENLKESPYAWDSKQMADGSYEVRVVASDVAANAEGEGKKVARVSDEVQIDHAPPVVGDVKVTVEKAAATLVFRVVDRGGAVSSLDFSLNSTDHWQRTLPDDKIADSPEERYTLKLSDLPKGTNTVTLRATDSAGNACHETVSVNCPDGKEDSK